MESGADPSPQVFFAGVMLMGVVAAIGLALYAQVHRRHRIRGGVMADNKVLPENAYRELKEGEIYTPVIPEATTVREISVRSVAFGLGMCVLFSAAAAYIALKLGQGIESAIPISILAIGFSALLARHSTLLENVNILAWGATSGIVVGGSVFTMPAIFVLGLEGRSSFFQIFIVPFLGAALGIVFLIPFRRYFVSQMHGKLPFPEGTAITEILMTGERGGQQAKVLVASMGVGYLFDKLALTFGVWRDVFTTSMVDAMSPLTDKVKAVFAINTSAAVLGLGYIIGVRYASIICAGSFLAYFVLIPLVGWIGGAIPGAFTSGLEPISAMSAEDIFDNYVRFIGIGGIFMAGVISIIKMSPIMVQALGKAFQEIRKMASGGLQTSGGRTDSDIPMGVVAGLTAVIALAIWLYFRFSVLADHPQATKLSLLSLALALVVSFLFAAVFGLGGGHDQCDAGVGHDLDDPHRVGGGAGPARPYRHRRHDLHPSHRRRGVHCTVHDRILGDRVQGRLLARRQPAEDPVDQFRRRSSGLGDGDRDDHALRQGIWLQRLGRAPESIAGAPGQRDGRSDSERDEQCRSTLDPLRRRRSRGGGR
jgi:hypothetical protein